MIYVLPLEGNFVPDEVIDPGLEAEKRIREHFAGQPVTRVSSVSMQIQAALIPGDIVIGNMAVSTAADVCARGARLFFHDPQGNLHEVSARIEKRSVIVNPPWNQHGPMSKTPLGVRTRTLG